MSPVSKQTINKKLGAPKAKGAVRAKTGCYTCRIRRKKCDERQNEDGECQTCVRLHVECLGFGNKRPEWLRENSKVLDMRERIKQFLAAQGMIKGTSGSGTRNVEHEPHRLRLSEGDYSSSSASPPTPVLSLPEELPHPTLTISSERDAPYPSPLSSYHGACSGQTLSPDSEYPARTPFLGDEDPMLSSDLSLLPPIQSNSLVTFANPWSNQTRYAPQSFPSPALGSTFSTLYSPNALYEEVHNNGFGIPPEHSIPCGPDISFFGSDDHLVRHYLDYVLKIQYFLADLDTTQDTISKLICSSHSTRDTACLLAAIHQYTLGIHGEDIQQRHQYTLGICEEDIQKRYDVVHHRLLGEGRQASHPSMADAMGGLLTVSSFLFSGGAGQWDVFLRVAVMFSKSILRQPCGPKEALIRCTKDERFIIKTSMWFDVLASASRRQIPYFLDEYRQMFGRNSAFIESPISMMSPREELSMMSVMGCENHIVWAMAEISNLAYWKHRQLRHGSLSMPELVERGKEIERHLLPGVPVDSEMVPEIDFQRYLTSELFRASSRIYLHTVISGSFPHCPEIQNGVQETINILQKIPTATPIAHTTTRNVVRSVVFSIFIAGCLTDNQQQRNYFLRCLSKQGEEPVGNCPKVKQVMEKVWEQHENRTDPVPWQEALLEEGMLLV